ncbi:MAG: TetR family transcriptional regulator [Hyphomicrobiaceae bacterium]
MLDLTTDKGRFVSAALALAAERPWQEVTLADIAERAGSTLVALKGQFSSKDAILSAFTTLVDDEVLTRAPRRDPEQAARDALFEVIMSRFDVLEPWKPAIRSIARSGPPEPGRLAGMMASSRWMLEAAGIGSGGMEGVARTAGLAAVYAAVFRTWLDDDDTGLARTMAALDRRLRRGERTMQRADDMMRGLRRVASAVLGTAETLRSRMDDVRRGTRPADPAPPPPSTPTP